MNAIIALLKKEPILALGALGVVAITVYNGIIAGHTDSTIVNDIIVALTALAGRSQVSPA